MLAFVFLFMLNSPLQGLKVVGSAEFSVLFMDIYDITLFSESQHYVPTEQPYALEIEYHRNVSAKRLVALTQDQWQHLGVSETLIERYGPQLLELWPDVSKGDRLTIYVTGEYSQFYHNDVSIGRVDAAEFGQLFTDIWLSPQTSAPRIRRDLLGSQRDS